MPFISISFFVLFPSFFAFTSNMSSSFALPSLASHFSLPVCSSPFPYNQYWYKWVCTGCLFSHTEPHPKLGISLFFFFSFSPFISPLIISLNKAICSRYFLCAISGSEATYWKCRSLLAHILLLFPHRFILPSFPFVYGIDVPIF